MDKEKNLLDLLAEQSWTQEEMGGYAWDAERVAELTRDESVSASSSMSRSVSSSSGDDMGFGLFNGDGPPSPPPKYAKKCQKKRTMFHIVEKELTDEMYGFDDSQIIARQVVSVQKSLPESPPPLSSDSSDDDMRCGLFDYSPPRTSLNKQSEKAKLAEEEDDENEGNFESMLFGSPSSSSNYEEEMASDNVEMVVCDFANGGKSSANNKSEIFNAPEEGQSSLCVKESDKLAYSPASPSFVSASTLDDDVSMETTCKR